MSGRDEQPIRDSPICPLCDSRPGYWILYSTDRRNGEDGWFWLFSDAYLNIHSRFSKVERHHRDVGHFPALDNIKVVVCGADTMRHHFRKGDATFHSVIEQIRKLEHEW